MLALELLIGGSFGSDGQVLVFRGGRLLPEDQAGGSSDHSALSNLDWVDSGHYGSGTGDIQIAAFGGTAGDAILLLTSDVVSDGLAILGLELDGGFLYPTTDGDVDLGWPTTHNWGNIFLGDTKSIIWSYGSSPIVMQGSSGVMTMSTGEMRITSPGTNSASVVTVGGTQDLSSKTLVSAEIDTNLRPAINDGAALGDATHNFSDFFLASGAVINFANGDVTLTHSAGALEITGVVTFDSEPVGIAFPRNHIAGLITSNNGTDATHDIDIAAGECRDATDAVNMVLASALTKQVDATWAVGTNAGGLDTGTVATGLYAIWLIKRSDTGVVDALFSTSFTSPTMPTSYDYKRLIGAAYYNSGWKAYTQCGDWFSLWDGIIDITDSTITSATFETGTVSVPPGCPGVFRMRYLNPTASTGNFAACYMRPTGSSASAGESTAVSFTRVLSQVTSEVYGTVICAVDGSSQVDYTGFEPSGSATVDITTHGFCMTTRSNP